MHPEPDLSRSRSHHPAITVLEHSGLGSWNQTPDRGNDVVNRGSITKLDRFDPAVLGKHLLGDLCGEIDVFIHDVVVQAVRLSPLDDEIRLSPGPTV